MRVLLVRSGVLLGETADKNLRGALHQFEEALGGLLRKVKCRDTVSNVRGHLDVSIFNVCFFSELFISTVTLGLVICMTQFQFYLLLNASLFHTNVGIM